jgi:Helix-turn-helix of DDE superfamily endonuclease
MSRYEAIRRWKPEKFKRLTGVSPATFERMVAEVHAHQSARRKKPGRPPKLEVEDQVLMVLEYLREYRTFAHIGASWGLDESNCYRTVCRIEDILIKNRAFWLPGRKALLGGGPALEVVLIDASESVVERPKKSSVASTAAKSSATR